MTAYKTSLNDLPADDFLFIKNHWHRYGENAFVQKLGRKWQPTEVRGGFKSAPLFDTKKAAGEYVTNLILAASRWEAAKKEGQ